MADTHFLSSIPTLLLGGTVAASYTWLALRHVTDDPEVNAAIHLAAGIFWTTAAYTARAAYWGLSSLQVLPRWGSTIRPGSTSAATWSSPTDAGAHTRRSSCCCPMTGAAGFAGGLPGHWCRTRRGRCAACSAGSAARFAASPAGACAERLIRPRLCFASEPHYPKAGPKGGRPAMPLEVMLRVYCLQQWYALSDPAAEGSSV